MNKKIIWLLATFFLATVSLAEAQQPAKIPRIGFVTSAGDPKNPGPRVQAFQRGCVSSVMSKGKTSRLNIVTLKETKTVCRVCR